MIVRKNQSINNRHSNNNLMQKQTNKQEFMEGGINALLNISIKYMYIITL